MDQLAIRVLRAARQTAHSCGLEPVLKRSRKLTRLFRSAYEQVKPEGLAEIQLPGYSLRISASDSSIAYNLLTLGCYEPYESSLFENAVRAGAGDVIDVGAHVGYYALMAANVLRSTGKVWAIEPHPANFALLQDNVARNRLDNVRCFNAAASDDSGTAPLFVSQDGNTGGHSLAAKPGQSLSVNVSLVCMDDVIPANTRVSVIKMDTEGAELKVLRGMRRILAENLPTIFTEFFPAAIIRAGHTPQEYLNELASYGYHFRVIDNDRQKVEPMCEPEILSTCRENGALNLLCTRMDA